MGRVFEIVDFKRPRPPVLFYGARRNRAPRSLYNVFIIVDVDAGVEIATTGTTAGIEYAAPLHMLAALVETCEMGRRGRIVKSFATDCARRRGPGTHTRTDGQTHKHIQICVYLPFDTDPLSRAED